MIPLSINASKLCGATIAVARRGLAVKTAEMQRDGSIVWADYPRESHWRFEPVEFTSIDGIAVTLAPLVRRQDAVLLRGSIKPGLDASREYRRQFRGEDAAVQDCDRSWLAVDVDDLPAPDRILRGSLATQAEFVRRQLPSEFHEAACVFTPTAKTGLSQGIRSRLWFMLSRPASNTSLRAWTKDVNRNLGTKLVDGALFNPVQPHYVGRPRFIGMRDPCSDQVIGMLAGMPSVDLKLPHVPLTTNQPTTTGSVYTGMGGWRDHLGRIGGPDGIREPLRAALSSAVAEAGGMPSQTLIDEIQAAALACRGLRPAGVVESYVTKAELDRMLDWIIAQETTQRTRLAVLQRRLFSKQ
ncbi:hypothetical protein [Microvirga arabica]|uniref:hypothetical protein n=1 Tax=Microvirga arabica TaxID=1128671 RepID=UPI00193A3E8E|nr:hypothetical protein [Microvirga arabica]MBM1174371.1 hypothetical protein [Microvirga arabica]